MSATATSILSQPAPYEPFGQTGVRQYAGRLLAWLCITISLCAAAMAQRSSGFFDELRWSGQGQGIRLVSAGGTASLFGGATQRRGSDTGWKYGGAYLSQIGYFGRQRPWNADWSTDWSRTVGFEVRSLPPMRDFDSGFFVRVKWSTIAALFMVQPVVYVLLRWRSRRSAAKDVLGDAR